MENKNYSKNIKKDIKREQNNDNKKKIFIIVLIALCVLALIFLGYKLFSTKDDDKKKGNKKEQIVEQIKEKEEEKQEEEKEEEYSYFSEENYVQNLKNEVNEKNNELKKETMIYRLTFNTNGGNEIDSSLFEENEITTEPSIPQRDGWSFAGWYKDSEFTEEYTFGSKLNEDTTIYAKWIKKIVFIVDDEEIYSKDYSENSLLELYTDETIENENVSASWTYLINDSIKEAIEGMIVNEENFGVESYLVELNYNPLTKFDIKFIYGEEDSDILTQKVIEGKTIDFTNINEIIKEKYPELNKYSWIYNVDGEVWTFSEYQKADSSITELTLNFDTYKIIYEEEIIIDEETTDYEIIDEVDYGKNTKINLIEAEDKDDKKFDGWYYNNGEENILIEDGYTMDKDMTLRGKWLEEEKQEETILALNPENNPTIEDQEKENLEKQEEVEEIPEEIKEEENKEEISIEDENEQEEMEQEENLETLEEQDNNEVEE